MTSEPVPSRPFPRSPGAGNLPLAWARSGRVAASSSRAALRSALTGTAFVAVFTAFGCAHKESRPTLTAAPPPEPAATVQAAVLRVPASPAAARKRYYVGALPDGGSTVRGRGYYYVREHNLPLGADPEATEGPTTYWREASTMAPTRAEMDDALSDASRTLDDLATENRRLSAALASMTEKVKAQPLPEAADQAAVPPTDALPVAGHVDQAQPPVAPVAPGPLQEQKFTFKPNTDNIIEITPELAFKPPGSRRVPFEQVFFPSPNMREISLRCSLVAPGEAPTVVLNNRILQPGDSIEGFRLDHPKDIDEDGVYLHRSFYRIRVPFQDPPITVRIPE